VGITVGSGLVPGGKVLWQEKTTAKPNNNINNNGNNNNNNNNITN